MSSVDSSRWRVSCILLQERHSFCSILLNKHSNVDNECICENGAETGYCSWSALPQSPCFVYGLWYSSVQGSLPISSSIWALGYGCSAWRDPMCWLHVYSTHDRVEAKLLPVRHGDVPTRYHGPGRAYHRRQRNGFLLFCVSPVGSVRER